MGINNPSINLFNFNYPVIKLNKDNVKVGTFFSGIGSPEMAFKRLKDNGIINNYEKDNLGDITKINGKNLPYCDIWIGGFPCQDISMAGIRRGFDFNSNTRSSLGWKMIQFIREMDNPPKVVIFENVAAITNSKMRKTLSLFKQDLENLGYSLYDHVLTALDYGTPQNREIYLSFSRKNKA